MSPGTESENLDFFVRLPEASLFCPEHSPLNPFLFFRQASEQADILRRKPCVIVDGEDGAIVCLLRLPKILFQLVSRILACDY